MADEKFVVEPAAHDDKSAKFRVWRESEHNIPHKQAVLDVPFIAGSKVMDWDDAHVDVNGTGMAERAIIDIVRSPNAARWLYDGLNVYDNGIKAHRVVIVTVTRTIVEEVAIRLDDDALLKLEAGERLALVGGGGSNPSILIVYENDATGAEASRQLGEVMMLGGKPVRAVKSEAEEVDIMV